MKKAFMLAAVALSALLTISGVTFGQQQPDTQIQQAAKSWLALVDSGRYAQSWDSASEEFKAKVTKSQWEGMLGRARSPLGKEESRTFKRAKEADNPPNSPPGKYELLQYSTAYQKQSSVAETVVLIEGKDGKWRVAGYFIQPPSN